MKFSKGIFSVSITLMKLPNVSSAFSVYVVLSDCSSVPGGPYLKNGTGGSYEHLDPLLNISPAETFLLRYWWIPF